MWHKFIYYTPNVTRTLGVFIFEKTEIIILWMH